MPDFIYASSFYELTALLALAAVVGFIGLLLKQPMVVSFIAVGLLAGNSALDLVQSEAPIDLLAELGIAVLLFLVGLKLDIQLIRSLGMVSIAAGLGQVLFTALIGFVIGAALGLDSKTSLYIAVALTFSSTIIIVKLLSDRHEADALYGRIAIGILIVQDLVVVLAMMVLSTFGMEGSDGQGTEASGLALISTALLYGTFMLAVVICFIRYLAHPLTARIAHSPELLVTFAIGWAALLASVGSHLGFSKELGGLLAGISLASTPYRESIIARLAALRDFLLLFFFISLGAHLDLSMLGTQMIPALVFSLFVLIAKPLIVMLIMGRMGYRKRTGFLTGLTVAQISEFSLIFMAMGVSLGHVSNEDLGLVTLVGLITIALSVYMITYSQSLYQWLEGYLNWFERRNPYREKAFEDTHIPKEGYAIILFGLGRYGKAITRYLELSGLSVLAVDFNPDEVRRWQATGRYAMYGDAVDPEFISHLPLAQVKWVISALPQHDVGLMHQDPRRILIDTLREHHFAGKIAISTQCAEDVELWKAKGADLVLLPFHDAAKQAVENIKISLQDC